MFNLMFHIKRNSQCFHYSVAEPTESSDSGVDANSVSSSEMSNQQQETPRDLFNKQQCVDYLHKGKCEFFNLLLLDLLTVVLRYVVKISNRQNFVDHRRKIWVTLKTIHVLRQIFFLPSTYYLHPWVLS